MDPLEFLADTFQMAGLYHLAADIEHTCAYRTRDDLSKAGQKALDEGKDSRAYRHETGLVVVSLWKRDLRLVSWSEIGADAFGEFVNKWWAENNPALGSSPIAPPQ